MDANRPQQGTPRLWADPLSADSAACLRDSVIMSTSATGALLSHIERRLCAAHHWPAPFGAFVVSEFLRCLTLKGLADAPAELSMPYLLDLAWNEAVLCTEEYPKLCESVLGAQGGIVHHSTRTADDADAVKTARIAAMAQAYKVKHGHDPRMRCDEYSQMIWQGSAPVVRAVAGAVAGTVADVAEEEEVDEVVPVIRGADAVAGAVADVDGEEEVADEGSAGAAVESVSPEETPVEVGDAARGPNFVVGEAVSEGQHGAVEENAVQGEAFGAHAHVGQKRQRMEDASGAGMRSRVEDVLVGHALVETVPEGQPSVADPLDRGVVEREVLMEEVSEGQSDAGDAVHIEPPVGNGPRGLMPTTDTPPRTFIMLTIGNIHDSSVASFKLGPGVSMEKLNRAYCARLAYKCDEGTCRLWKDAGRLSPSDTPASLGLESGDSLSFIPELAGC